MSVDGTSAQRTQADRRNASEEALLAAAAELVAERGIDGATLASIGQRAGASRGLPTHYFGSKDGLIERLAGRAQDRLYEAMVAEIDRLAESSTAVTGLELICLSVDTYLAMYEHPTPELRALIVMWGSTFPEGSAVDGMLEAEKRNFEGWAGLTSIGQQDGSIRDDLGSDEVALLIYATIRGLAGMMLTSSESIDVSEMRRSCRAWISRALAPAEAG